MKVLLVAPNHNPSSLSRYGYSFPLGIAYISGALIAAGHDVDCLNLYHSEVSPDEEVRTALDRKNYDFLMTGGYSFGYDDYATILGAARAHSSSPRIVLGGPIVTTEPELVVGNLRPDFGVIGEGEQTVVELLKILAGGGDPATCNGIVIPDESGVILTAGRALQRNLATIAQPDLDGLEFERHLDGLCCNDFFYSHDLDYPRVYTILASRGCPYKCTFCYHTDMYRMRPMADVMAELEEAVPKYRINLIALSDECMGLRQERVLEICRGFTELRQRVPWDLKWTGQLIVSTVTRELLQAMRDSGCCLVSYGFESYSPAVLKSMKKPITQEQIDAALKLTLELGMGIQGNFIFGDLAETVETSRQTLDYWKAECKGQINLDFIRAYPNSKLYESCFERGLLQDKMDYMRSGFETPIPFNMTTSMTDEELQTLYFDVASATVACKNYTVPRVLETDEENRCTFEARCPFCLVTVTYNNWLLPDTEKFVQDVICRNCHHRFRAATRPPFFKRLHNKARQIALRYPSLRWLYRLDPYTK